MGIVVRYMQ